jgi:hypothetical protein
LGYTSAIIKKEYDERVYVSFPWPKIEDLQDSRFKVGIIGKNIFRNIS